MRCLRSVWIKSKPKGILMLIIFWIGIGIYPSNLKASETNKIKVGYPIVSGFTEVEDGIYTGYAYEYLMEIAKSTGWEYEFIEMSLEDLIYKLRDGEIDLASGMLKNEQTEALYDFPEVSAGYTYTTLSVLKENNTISSSNYETFHGIKVGYYETSKVRLSNFIKFCEDHEIEGVELIPYPYNDEELLLKALKNKEVDAIINGDLIVQGEHKVVAKFGPTPYYFATTVGNKKVLSGLNTALYHIQQENPNFSEELYNKYFKSYIDHSVHLTKEEKEYIEQMTPLKAVYIDYVAPMQAYNPETMEAEGVFIDIFESIAGRSGLKYELIRVDTYNEAYEMIKNKEVDLLISAPNNYSRANEYEFSLTQSYFEMDMVRVMNTKDKGEKKGRIIAVPIGYIPGQLEDGDEVRNYETIEACLKAVKVGEVDVAYGNNYTVSKYFSSGYYPNLSIVFEQIPVKVCIAIAKPVDLELLNIINKSVDSLEESDIQNIIYENTLSIRGHVTLKQFFFDNLSFCISIIIVFIGLIAIIMAMKHRRLKEDKLFFLEKSQTDALTGVYNREAGIEKVTAYLETKKTFLYSALIMIDIDYFKQVNDRLGHQVGDDLLKEFSQLLKGLFETQDIILRLGGDEFIIFMTDLESSGLEVVRNKLHQLQKAMDKEISHKENAQKISLSMGGVITNKAKSFNTLYEEADHMLYEVKRNGRNGFKIKVIYE